MKSKMNVINAQSVFGLSSIEQLDREGLKKLYKSEIFKTHPDRGGDKQLTQRINDAYSVLKKLVKDKVEHSSESKTCHHDINGHYHSEQDDWLFEKNAGHPLHESGLAALKTRESLLYEAFDIRDSETTPGINFTLGKFHVHGDNGIHFKKEGMMMELRHWLGHLDHVVLTDTTNGFRHRKTCGEMHIRVSHYGAYPENSRSLVNVLRDWLGSASEKESGFHWCDLYTLIVETAARAFQSLTNVCDIFGCELQVSASNYKVFEGTLRVGDCIITIEFDELASHTVFNPFNIGLLKPLTKTPKRWKVSDIVKLLINGQFHSCKQSYYYTDDYVMDNALGFREGFHENPILLAKKWHGEKIISCTSLYESTPGELIFGFHSNDGNELKIDLDNRYPLVDLEQDVLALESQLKLMA